MSEPDVSITLPSHNVMMLERARKARDEYGDVLDKAKVLDSLKWVFDEEIGERFDEEDMPSQEQLNEWLADALALYVPDCWIEWDNMGGASIDPSMDEEGYLRSLVTEVLPPRTHPDVGQEWMDVVPDGATMRLKKKGLVHFSKGTAYWLVKDDIVIEAGQQ
jgi:hypothetical protein